MLRGFRSPRPVWLLAATAVAAAAIVSAAPPPPVFEVNAWSPGAPNQHRRTHTAPGSPEAPPAHGQRRRTHAPPEPYAEPERLCVMQGGVCRYASHCPKGMLTSVRGLCPLQRSKGIECCYSRPKRMKPIHHKNKNQWKRNHNKDWAQRRWHQYKMYNRN